MAEAKRIRLLAVDMDGTCLNGRSQMAGKTLQALKLAAESGITVVPATGRSLSCLPHRLAGRMDIYRYVISSNGASVADLWEKRELAQTLIPREKALALIAKSGEQGFGSTAHIRHEYYVEGRMLSFCGRVVFGRDAGKLRNVRNMTEVVKKSPYDIEEIQFYFLSAGAKKRIQMTLQEFPELSAAYTRIYVEIFAENASKGNALAFLADRLGITKEETACIGDGENDLPMFEAAGLKLAMKNAVPRLKEKADAILPDRGRDGAAEGIRRIIRQNAELTV